MRRADENGKPDKNLDDGKRKTLLVRSWRGSSTISRRSAFRALVEPAVERQQEGKGREENPSVEARATAIAENEHREKRYGDKPRACDKRC